MYDVLCGLLIELKYLQAGAVEISRIGIQGTMVIRRDVGRRNDGQTTLPTLSWSKLCRLHLVWVGELLRPMARPLAWTSLVWLSTVLIWTKISSKRQKKWNLMRIYACWSSSFYLQHCERRGHLCARKVWGTKMYKSAEYFECVIGVSCTDKGLSGPNYNQVSLT